MDEVIVEINDLDRKAIGEQIKEGYTSGRLDSENGKKISWSIEMEVWAD